jgi:hypothetical protein
MNGLSNADPFLRDIEHAAKVGHFDRRRAEGPSQLECTSVDELLEAVSTMSPERRRIYLAQIGRIWGERAMLSGGKRSKRTRLWLSKSA